MKKGSKISFFTVLVLCLTLFLAACGGGKSQSTTTKGSNKGKKNSATASTKQVKGKPLVMVPSPYGSFKENFNPFSPNKLEGTQGLIYEPLAYLDSVSGKTYNFLAKNTAWSNGNKTLTVTLKDNVKWSDGKPFSADDVVFTFQLLKNHKAADTSGIWSHLSSIQKAGSNKVAFNFKQPNVPFQSYILNTLIVPKHIWKDIKSPTKAQVTKPVGTGPYTLQSFDPSVFVLKARSDYYGGNMSVPEIKFPSYNGNQSIQLALTQGKIDWAGIFINNADKVYASKSKDNNYWFPPKNNFMLYTNLKKPLLKDNAVRKAMSLGIDRKAISQKAESGFAPPSNPTGRIAGHSDWENPNLPSQYKSFRYDPNKAMQVLKNAGYKKNSKGIFTKNGKPLSFTLYTVSGWTDWATMTQLLKQDMQKIGIQIKVQQLQYGAYANDVQNGKFQLAISWTDAGATPFNQYKDLLDTNGSWNLEQWSNPKSDQALQAFANTTDKQKQKQAIFKLQNILAKDLPSIPLVQGPVWYEYNNKNYTGWPTKNNAYVDPAPHDWPAPAIVLRHLKPVN